MLKVNAVYDKHKSRLYCASDYICTYLVFCVDRFYLYDFHSRRMNPHGTDTSRKSRDRCTYIVISLFRGRNTIAIILFFG